MRILVIYGEVVQSEGFYSASFSRFGGNTIKKRKLAIRVHPYVDNKKEEDNSFGLELTLIILFIVIGIFSFF